MTEIKIRYTVKRENGFTFSQIFSIQDIERGDAKLWFERNYVSDVVLDRELVEYIKEDI
jgi:hypothetical protein